MKKRIEFPFDLLVSAADRVLCDSNPGDDIYLGPAVLGYLGATSAENPSANIGAGPAARIFYLNNVPLTKQAANAAALQALTATVPMVLAAGTGATLGTAPDGSGNAVIVFDMPRCASITATTNLSAINFTIVGYDQYANKMSQKLVGPNNTTVNTLKAFSSILSVTPDTTSANQASIGTADIFGLPYCIQDAGYIQAVKWANVLAQDAGTFTIADSTNPATNLTGDVRGTYAPSSASNGARRLVIAMHLPGTQIGTKVTSAYGVGLLLGVPQA